MKRRTRLMAVRGLLLAALLQVAAPVEAALLALCPQMAAAAAEPSHHCMPGMDMAAMATSPQDAAASHGDHASHGQGGSNPHDHPHCLYDCCRPGHAPAAATTPTPVAFSAPARYFALARIQAPPAELRLDGRQNLRPAIRGPPAAA